MIPDPTPLPSKAQDDPFRPPDEPCEVRCLHCDQQYMSNLIYWDPESQMWLCPTPGCGGAGYEFDIHPVATWPFGEEGEDEEFDEEPDDEP